MGERYLDVTDKTVHGMDISIWEMETGYFDVDIKKPCGEVIHAMADFDDFEQADCWAVGFIDGYVIAERLRNEKTMDCSRRD